MNLDTSNPDEALYELLAQLNNVRLADTPADERVFMARAREALANLDTLLEDEHPPGNVLKADARTFLITPPV